MELNITLVIQLSLFIGLFIWLSNVILYPLLDLFEEREKRIEGAALEAKELSASATASAGEIDDKLNAARQEARTILGRLRTEGQEIEKNLTDSSRERANTRIEEARTKLATSSTQIRGNLSGQADDLAQEIVEKILGRTI